jgi:hypothetical protein
MKCTTTVNYFNHCTYMFQGAYRVHQCCYVQSPIHMCLQYDVKTEHHVMAKKLKFVKILMCPVCWCVNYVVCVGVCTVW